MAKEAHEVYEFGRFNVLSKQTFKYIRKRKKFYGTFVFVFLLIELELRGMLLILTAW